jgi:hypothetical protein
MLNNSYQHTEKKIYMKLLINKIIESKLNKIHNQLTGNNIPLNFNYSNIKNEFKNILNHKGGYNFNLYQQTLPYDSLYTSQILIPFDAVFSNNNFNEKITEKVNEIKKMLIQFIKITEVFNKNYDEHGKDNKAIEALNSAIEMINRYLREDYDEKKINEIFINLIENLTKFNYEECIKIKTINPEISKEIENLCKI